MSSKAISVTLEETESEGKEKSDLKSQCQRDQKISAQSSQIQDLCEKLDRAIAKNTQIREWLNPETLQTVFTNALQASGQHFRTQVKFFGKRREPKVAPGIDGTTDPDKHCNYCKDTGHVKENCLCLQKHNAFVASRSWEGLN